MIPLATPPVVEYATGDSRSKTLGWTTSSFFASAVSAEGMTISAKVLDVLRVLKQQDVVVAGVSTAAVVSLAAPVPDSWLGLAQAVFPNSRRMTRAERRALDAAVWTNSEPIDFIDD